MRPLSRFFARTLLYDEFSILAYRVRRFRAQKANRPNLETR